MQQKCLRGLLSAEARAGDNILHTLQARLTTALALTALALTALRKQHTHEVCAGAGVRAGWLRVGGRELPVSTSVIRVRQLVPAAHSWCPLV